MIVLSSSFNHSFYSSPSSPLLPPPPPTLLLHSGPHHHILYPADAFRPMTIPGARYSTPTGYQATTTGGSTTSATGTLQPLTHFSTQQPYQYVATNTATPQNSGYHTATLQQRPVQGIAYGQVLQPSLQVSSPAIQGHYHLAQQRHLQPSGVSSTPSYSLLPTTVSTPERRQNPPSYSPQQEAFPSAVQQGIQVQVSQQQVTPPQAGRHWSATNYP